MTFDRDRIKTTLAALASRGLLIGTSSWKYPGWRGQLYEDDRYIWRGRFSEKRFENFCLSEYAEVFKTVCVDAAYYTFPAREQVESLAGQTPEDFQFAFKATDSITLKRFPSVPRCGEKGGTLNPEFLDADRFIGSFLQPLEGFREKVGIIIFEFSRFSGADFERGREFVEQLEAFLARLPCEWSYGVEVRNRSLLHPEFFEVLQRRGAAFVFSSWQDMPPLDEQLSLAAGAGELHSLLPARLLLRPGRKYEEAVKRFSPYNRMQDPYPEGREAAVKLMKTVLQSQGKKRGMVFVNNRFEGNALATIAAMVDRLEAA